jgi:DNA-3-methyladenine glycosylase II
MDKALIHLSQDKKLKKIIDVVGEPKLRVDKNHFRALVESIVSQQLSIKAADAIFFKFFQLFEPSIEKGIDLYTLSFPTPKEVSLMDAKRLRSVGLSEKKVIYIHALAMAILDASLDFEEMKTMNDDEGGETTKR